MNDTFEFFSPVKMTVGEKAINTFPDELINRKVYRPLIISDTKIKKSRIFRQFTSHLKRSRFKNDITLIGPFEEFVREVSLRNINKIAGLYEENGCDGIIAIGGNLLLGTAQAVNILVSEGGDDLSAYAGERRIGRRLNPLVAVASSPMTGAEITPMVIAADKEKGKKVVVISEYLLPDLVLIDPKLADNLPTWKIVASSMEAFTHAMESYTCGGKNPISDDYCGAALRLISHNLPAAVKKPKDKETKTALTAASVMAGIALSNTMLGMTHILGYCTQVLCGIHQGIVMGILLPYVLEHEIGKGSHYTEKAVGNALLPLAGPEVCSTVGELDRSKKVIDFLHTFTEQLHRPIGLPTTLQETGKISIDHLQDIALSAIAERSSLFNPAAIEKKGALDILTKAYSGKSTSGSALL